MGCSELLGQIVHHTLCLGKDNTLKMYYMEPLFHNEGIFVEDVLCLSLLMCFGGLGVKEEKEF